VIVAINNTQVATERRKAAKQDAEAELERARGKANAISEINAALAESPNYISYLMVENLADDIQIIYTADGTIQMLQAPQSSGGKISDTEKKKREQKRQEAQQAEPVGPKPPE